MLLIQILGCWRCLTTLFRCGIWSGVESVRWGFRTNSQDWWYIYWTRSRCKYSVLVYLSCCHWVFFNSVYHGYMHCIHTHVMLSVLGCLGLAVVQSAEWPVCRFCQPLHFSLLFIKCCHPHVLMNLFEAQIKITPGNCVIAAFSPRTLITSDHHCVIWCSQPETAESPQWVNIHGLCVVYKIDQWLIGLPSCWFIEILIDWMVWIVFGPRTWVNR